MKLKLAGLFLLLSISVEAAEFAATLDYSNRRQLAFAGTGLVDKVMVASGEQVKPKQLLAQLDLQPFVVARNQAQAHVEMLAPRVFDAKQDYDQAQELYQRTVLSQIELQKAETRYKGVQAEQAIARGDYEMAQWMLNKASLYASCVCVVTRIAIVPGMAINSQNQHLASIELAELGVMEAEVSLDNSIKLNIHQGVQIIMDKQKIAGSVVSINTVDGKRVARVQFQYNADGQLIAGQTVKVVF